MTGSRRGAAAAALDQRAGDLALDRAEDVDDPLDGAGEVARLALGDLAAHGLHHQPLQGREVARDLRRGMRAVAEARERLGSPQLLGLELGAGRALGVAERREDGGDQRRGLGDHPGHGELRNLGQRRPLDHAKQPFLGEHLPLLAGARNPSCVRSFHGVAR